MDPPDLQTPYTDIGSSSHTPFGDDLAESSDDQAKNSGTTSYRLYGIHKTGLHEITSPPTGMNEAEIRAWRSVMRQHSEQIKRTARIIRILTTVLCLGLGLGMGFLAAYLKSLQEQEQSLVARLAVLILIGVLVGAVTAGTSQLTSSFLRQRAAKATVKELQEQIPSYIFSYERRKPQNCLICDEVLLFQVQDFMPLSTILSKPDSEMA